MNNLSLEGMHSVSEVQKCLEESGEVILLSVMKSVGPVGAPLSSSSSSHNIGDTLETTFKSTMPNKVDKSSQATDESRLEGLIPVGVSSPESSQTVVAEFRAEDQSPLKSDYTHVRKSSQPANYPPTAQSNSLLDRAYQRIFKEPRSKNTHGANAMSMQEAEATAALDSVIDHFSQMPELKATKRRKKKEKDKVKNGGTWPKYRGPPLDYSDVGTATVRAPQKKKERKSIHSIAAFPKQFSIYEPKGQNMNPGGGDCTSSQMQREHDSYYVSYKHNHVQPMSSRSTMTGMPVIRPNSPTYHSSPTSTPIKKATDHIHFSTASSPATSLDYSVVSAQRDKEVLEFYKNKNKPRPKSAHYIISADNEFSVQMDSNVPGHSKSVIMDNYGKQFELPHFTDTPQPIRSSHPYMMSSASNTQLMRISHPYVMNGQRHGHPHYASPSISTSPPPTSPPPASPRYSLPGGLAIYSSRSGDIVGPPHGMNDAIDPRRFQRIDSSGQYTSITPSPSPSQYSFGAHSPTNSMDLPHFHPNYSKRPMPVHSHSPYREEMATFSPCDGLSTIAKRTHQRIRIPSNHSVTSKSSIGKVSSSSIEKASTISDRDSPIPNMTVEMISPGGGSHSSSVNDFRGRK